MGKFTAHTISLRLRLDVDRALMSHCLKGKVTKSEVIQNAVECYLKNPKCLARRRKS